MFSKLFAIAAISAGLVLSGCNTIRGVGQDVQSVADAGDEVI